MSAPAPQSPNVLLRHYDRVDRRILLVPATAWRSELEAAAPACAVRTPNGWGVVRDDQFMAVYRDDAGLWFYTAGTAHEISHATLACTTEGSRRRLAFTVAGSELVAVEFVDEIAAQYYVAAPFDFTAAQPEDVDWALHLQDTLGDPGRRERVGRPRPS